MWLEIYTESDKVITVDGSGFAFKVIYYKTEKERNRAFNKIRKAIWKITKKGLKEK